MVYDRYQTQYKSLIVSGLVMGPQITGADLGRANGGGVWMGVDATWGVGWTVELKLNRKKRKSSFQPGGVRPSPTPLDPPVQKWCCAQVEPIQQALWQPPGSVSSVIQKHLQLYTKISNMSGTMKYVWIHLPLKRYIVALHFSSIFF